MIWFFESFKFFNMGVLFITIFYNLFSLQSKYSKWLKLDSVLSKNSKILKLFAEMFKFYKYFNWSNPSRLSRLFLDKFKKRMCLYYCIILWVEIRSFSDKFNCRNAYDPSIVRSSRLNPFCRKYLKLFSFSSLTSFSSFS